MVAARGGRRPWKGVAVMMTEDVEGARRQAELKAQLRVSEDVAPSKQGYAELLLDLSRRRKLLDGRRKPLRVLAEAAHLSPQLLELQITTEQQVDYSTVVALATLKGPSAAQLWRSLGHDVGDANASGDLERKLTLADEAVLDLIGHWPDERKYALATALEQILAAGREDNSHD